MAAGNARKGAKIGDVLFPRTAYNNDGGKIDKDGKHLPEGNPINGHQQLHEMAQFIDLPGIVVHFEDIFSGATVVDNPSLFDRPESISRKVHGYDMECYGFYDSMQQKGVPFFFAKGVSDIGAEKTDDYQHVATSNASKFSLKLIELFLKTKNITYRKTLFPSSPGSNPVPISLTHLLICCIS